MHIFWRDGHVGQEQVRDLFVIAAGIIGGHQPLIAPKEVGLLPGHLVAIRPFAPQLVNACGCAAAGEGDGETAVGRHRFLRQVNEQLNAKLIDLLRRGQNMQGEPLRH